MLVILNVIYVLVAISMVALSLLQRGAGAAAGSGFGAGASATVFGSTGAGNFLSKATKWLAIVFMSISMYMAWHAANSVIPAQQSGVDLGVMAEVPSEPASVPAIPEAGNVPQVPAAEAPAVEVPPAEVPADEPAATDAQPEPAPGG